ncbi:hypothetical protein M2322_002021 [Rhodoblastus acidophilus]|uniref:hypothetical protein n=1 Tax=Rhodoblastus acidophilus TaxID=1074 RepID=UPI002225A962|nr:hypothetical protein [Rhodoblastus acidophilus]MCW2316473.1 hypothetical protein [Rhodoblastus acidophilus]
MKVRPMCDIARERNRIDAMIVEAIAPFRYLDSAGEALLVDLACASLSIEFLDFVAPWAIRARCERVVGGLLRARRARQETRQEQACVVMPAE